MRLLILTTCLSLIFNSCKKEDDINPTSNNGKDTSGNTLELTADFSYKILINDVGPDTFQFKNNSKNATSIKWYFGDIDSSSIENPFIVFPDEKTYTVKLFTYNGSQQKFLVRKISVKDLTVEDTIKNPNSIKPTANFKIYYNVDSNNVLHTFNTSTSNSISAMWFVDDVLVSDQYQPSLQVDGNKSSVKVTLIVKESFGRKDTLSKIINLNDYQVDFGSTHYLLKSTSPVTYSFHHTRYYNRYGISAISFGDIYTSNRVQFVQGYEKTFDNNDEQTVIFSLDLPNYTVYKRVKTFNITELIPIFNSLPGQYLFEERYSLKIVNSYSTRTNFNDTVLNLSQINTTKFTVSDTTLKHYFEGFLSSYTNSSTLDFRVPNVNYPEIGSYYQSFLKLPRNTSTIQAEEHKSIGNKVSESHKLIYTGRKL